MCEAPPYRGQDLEASDRCGTALRALVITKSLIYHIAAGLDVATELAEVVAGSFVANTRCLFVLQRLAGKAELRIDSFECTSDELHVQLRRVVHVAYGAAGLEQRFPGHAAQAGQLKAHAVKNGFLATCVSGMCIHACPLQD